ncbi:Response regulator containing a CheY-like receiver domain and a GGDEF domain [Hahella chejuensis KCTC 2396]|uniref:Response regulator containing a CheY-like receiver domain and a GGDEF domain n=1 Tax=Hahella chejuensis (strain KCTC 2396) TaxID=349521 RepID=Q2SA46_HAHCH|nr:response regulator [Hahella chejuensis]ABC32478.1 Response regulator containing a CheY-like receiver domain and a GGDEF domain [Hahella chejuensis KCTC 2396]
MNKKVLIVDDSETDLKHLEQIVSGAAYQTVTARSGEEAISKARKEKPSLILMDIIMGDMDGFSTCREIAQDPELSKIPVVFVSSKNQKVDHIWAAKQGAKALVSKPYKNEEILSQLHSYA